MAASTLFSGGGELQEDRMGLTWLRRFNVALIGGHGASWSMALLGRSQSE